MGCGSSKSKTSKTKQNSYLDQEGTKTNQDKKTSSFFTLGQNNRAFRLQNDLYVEQEHIGNGSFSDVYLYRKDSDGSLHALKVLKDNTTKDAFLHECQIMRDVQSQFVIKIEEIIQIDDQLCIMIEYANQGTLESFISNISQQTVSVSANQILDLACDIFQGLNTLHAKNIIHRDLKMENLLVSNYQAKIADLGVATYLISKSYAKTNIGNMLYAAPEKLNQKYNSASDIFSAGLIILQIIISLTTSEILRFKITQNYISQIQDSPENLKNFIKSLLDINPELRPSAIDAYNLCRTLKYDQEVLNYINNKINEPKKNSSGAKNLQISEQKSQQQNIQSTETASKSISLEEQLFQKGMELYWKSDIKSADQCFSTILEKNPVSVKGLCGRLLCGWVYSWQINMKQYSDDWIQNQLKFIQQLNSNCYMYHYCSGVINKDIDSFNKCIELNPNMAEAIVWKASLLADQNKTQEAIQLGQQALEISDNSFVLRMLGCIYYNINFDTSEQFYLRSLQVSPNEYITLNNLGALYKNKKKQYNKALEYLNQALSICPYYQKSIEQKIEIMKINKQFQDLNTFIVKIFQECGELEILYFNLAYSYQQIKNNSKALEYYVKSLLYQEDGATLLNIGSIYDESKDYEMAKEYYQKAIQKKVKLAYTNMYYTCSKLNQEQKGEEYLAQLLELEFDINDEDDCQSKILVHKLLKQFQQALNYSELSLKQHPQSQAVIDVVLKLISDETFFEELSQQCKLAEQIQKNFGISYESTICQLKYLRANKMDDLVVNHILNYYEEIIHKKQNLDGIFAFRFSQYVNDNQFEKIFQSLKIMCENDPSNIYSQTCYLGLACNESIKYNFSQNMIQDLETVYNNNNKLFEDYPDQCLIQFSRIYCFVIIQFIKFNKQNLPYEQFQEILSFMDQADIQVKKRFQVYHSLQQNMYYQIIIFLKQQNKSQQEIDSLEEIKSQKLKESLEFFPNFKPSHE
ncbi:hypothetical protein ABPG72_019237 [Tetrahymena utriculariae]